MGFQTGVMILNDAIGYLEDAKVRQEFCSDLLVGINTFGMGGKREVNLRIGNHGNGATIFHEAHADTVGVYAIGKNYTSALATHVFGLKDHAIHTPEAHLAMIRQIADALGYRLVSKGK
jgi:hypothetical protein